MRIRATLASGKSLIAPTYNSWLSEKEKKRIDAWRERSVRIPETTGQGWEPVCASVPFTTHMPPALYGMLRC